MKMTVRTFLLLCSMAAAFALPVVTAANANNNCDIINRIEDFASTNTAPTGATCSLFLGQSARTGVSCHWEYSFRDAAAPRQAKEMWSGLRHCRAGIEPEPDQLVNHPDSYDLKEWISKTGIYSISVKDKGQLERTLVFFRYEKTDP